ncbi:unnamed protein product [Coregonus sp. 'balchen']|nr:unnamed protein product [Coregonus sp. 'balchen']
MEEWQEKRGLQTMNLRSVFTLEQQRVLESYYDNGMTNQSKSCFQLILQCAQETKLDFSVVRVRRDFSVVCRDFSVVRRDFSVVRRDFSVVRICRDFSVVCRDFSVVRRDFSVVCRDFSVVRRDFSVVRRDFSVVRICRDFSVVCRDFSVVRRDFSVTWVGNKRRKLASRADQNAGVSHSLSFSNHGLARGALSNHSLAGGALSNHSVAEGALSNHTLAGGALVAGAMLTVEMAAARNIQRGSSHLLPPSFSSSSSSSPLSSGNNNDVILTGIYSLGSASSSRPTVKPLPSDAELPAHVHQTLLNQSQHRRNSSVLSKRVGFPTSGARAGGAVGVGGAGAGGAVGGGVPQSWARQYGSLQPGPWPSPSQPQPRPHSNHQTPPPHLPRHRPSPPPHPNPPPSNHSPRIHQVFSVSERGEGEAQGQPSDRSRQERHRQTPRPSDAIGCLSIAMETGGEEDEWRREEELSNMATTAHGDLQRGQWGTDSLSPSRGEGSVGRGLTSPSLVLSSSRPGPYPRGSYPVTTTLQTSPSIQAEIIKRQGGRPSGAKPACHTAPAPIGGEETRERERELEGGQLGLISGGQLGLISGGQLGLISGGQLGLISGGRGSAGPDLRGQGGQLGLISGGRGPAGPDLRGQGPAGPDLRGPAGPDLRGQGASWA